MKVKLFIEKPGIPPWDPKKQTIEEYNAENCIAWDSPTPEEQHEMAVKLNAMAMKSLGYSPCTTRQENE